MCTNAANLVSRLAAHEDFASTVVGFLTADGRAPTRVLDPDENAADVIAAIAPGGYPIVAIGVMALGASTVGPVHSITVMAVDGALSIITPLVGEKIDTDERPTGRIAEVIEAKLGQVVAS